MDLGQIKETRTYLTFTLDQEDFAVDVAGVREVLDYTNVTRVPRTPDFMKGVINLRGSVVPVVDMRLKFGLPEGEKTVDTCIIVLEVEMDGEVTVIGAIADSVKEVFELESDHIEPPPRLGTRFETEFISGMGKYNDEFLIILDVNRVFSNQELELFRQAEETRPPQNSDAVGKKEGPPTRVGDGAEEARARVDGNREKKEPDREKAEAVTAAPEKSTGSMTSPKKPPSGNSRKGTRKAGKPGDKKI